VFEDRPALNLFRRVVSRAIKLPGIVDVAHPDYDAEIRYSNGRTTGLHLWLHPKGTAASIMYVDDTHTMYRVPEDIAGELFKRLQPYAEQPANERSGPVGEEPSALPSEDPDAGGSVPEYRGAGVFSLVAGDTPIAPGAWDHEIDLEAILGPPVGQDVEVLENADTHTGSFVKKMEYDGLRLELFSPKQNGETFHILSMKASGEGYRTTRDIAVGSTLDDLLLAYPEVRMAPDGRTDPANAAYEMSDELSERFLRFEVADGRVAEIHLYRVLP
jgi:hypothetical protein